MVLGASGRVQIGLIDVRNEGKKERVNRLAMRLTDILDNDVLTDSWEPSCWICRASNLACIQSLPCPSEAQNPMI